MKPCRNSALYSLSVHLENEVTIMVCINTYGQNWFCSI